jgi:flagellar hook assembly protein FlgD
MIKEDVRGKLQATREVLGSLKTTLKEIDLESLIMKKMGGLKGNSKSIEDGLKKLKALMAKADELSAKLSEKTAAFFKSFSGKSLLAGGKNSGQGKAAVAELMERVMKSSLASAIGDGVSGAGKILSSFNVSFVKCIKKSLTKGAGATVKVGSLLSEMFNGPANLVRTMAEKELKPLNGFVAATQKNMVGLYVNVLYTMSSLYSMIDVEDPCFPTQPLLQLDSETGKPLPAPVEIFVPQGDTYEGWIEAHDVTSGLNPQSFTLYVKDVTKGSVGAYAIEQDLFKKGGKAWTTLGENPLDEKRRGKGLKVLKETAFPHMQLGLLDPVSFMMNMILGKVGGGSYKMAAGEALYKENRIERARFNFSLDLKDAIGNTIKLSPKVFDRAGRPSSILAPNYFVKFIRDENHPFMMVQAPNLKGDNLYKSGDRVKVSFSIDDVSGKNTTKADSQSVGISGVSLGDISLSFLRHGKTFLRRQMTEKNITKGKLWKGINREELSASARTGSLSSKGSLVKDPVVFELSENLPEGEYELRIEARDRAGNKTVNGTPIKSNDKAKASAGGISEEDVPSIIVIVGTPDDVVIIPSLDPHVDIFTPGSSALVSLNISSRIPDSTIERIDLKIGANAAGKAQTDPGKGEKVKKDEKGKEVSSYSSILEEEPLAKLKAGLTIGADLIGKSSSRSLLIPDVFTLAVKKADFRQGALLEFPVSARVKVSGRESLIEADFTILVEVKGRLAPSDVFFESNIKFEDSKGSSHPLPFGTKVSIAQIYKMPLAGLGAAGLKAGGSKYVEQYVGYGEIDNSAGHLLCRVRPVGGREPTKFRVVADSFAVEPLAGGGKRGIASVVGTMKKVPFKIVGLPFNPASEILAQGSSKVTFLRYGGGIVIPGHKSEKHPVLLKYEGELTTGGHINPWGDMGQGGAGAFAMSMTLAGQMAEVSKLGNESGPDSTIPGLLYRNHTDAFMALSAMVKAYQFSKGCSKISAPSSLRFEFGTGFIPLLPSSSQSLIDAYGGDSSSDVDPATDTGSDSDSGSGVNKVADNMLKHLQSLRTNLNDDAKLVAMTDELIRLSEGLFSSMAVIDEAERELALARGRKERAALRKTEIPGKKTWIKATIMVLRERQLAFGNEPSVNGDLDSEIATFEAILKALEAEEEWLLEKEKSFSDELEALNKRLKANQEAFSAMRKDFLSEKQNLAAFSGEAGVSSDILNIPGPFERFDSFSSYVPEEEKDNIKRQLEIEVYLAEMKKERVRRELKKEPLELKGQMARWWPSARDDNTGGTVLYKIDYEKNKRIMIPDGKGGNAEDMYRVARAYGSYIRQTNIARELAKVPSYDYSGPVGILDKTNAVRQAWDEGFDTFFASAIMGTPFFFDGVDSKKVDYQETISSLGKWDSKLKNRYKLRGLDNPKAVATAFWLLYERFGKDFLANILGYGERLHFPKLVQWYPELTEEFMSLGLLPVLSFSSGKNGLPVISWDDNGIVRDCRDLSFIVEYSRSSAFSDDVHTIVGNASKVIDFGKALDPEDSNFVLGNVLEDGNWYFRARLENGWAKEIFGEAATGTSVFTVSRPSVKIGPSGGQVPFESGSVKGRIDVDAGALPSDTNISATSLSIPGDIEGYHVVGSTAFEFLPEVSYQKVAKFTFEYSDEDVSGVNEKDIGLYKYNKETGKFAAVKHTRDEKTNQITAYRSGHSVYALLVDTQPPAMESVRDGKDPFNPEAGVISIEVAASEAADFTISIKDSSGKAVREFESEVFDSGKGKVFWDGRNEEGLIALDGQYTYTVFATDLTGKKSIPLSGRMWVLRGGGNTVSGKVSLKDGSNPSSVEVFIDEMTLQAPVDRNGNFSLSGVPFGNHSFTATLDGWFPARWENVMVKSEQDTVLTSAVISNTILSTFKMVSKTVSPDGDGINDVFVARYETTQDVPVTVEIYNDQNRLINTPLSGKLNKQGPHTLVWDCLTEEGVVSGGLHYLKFYGHSGNQKLLQKETTFIVDTGLACALYTDPVQFSPNGDGLDDLTSVMFKVTSTATVTVEIVDSMKSPVATLIDKKEYTEGYVNISWDGTSDHGDMLPDGRYTAVLRSFYPDGTPSISFEKLLVLDSIVPSIGNVTPVNGSILTTGMPLVTARVVASPGDVPSGYVKVKIDEVTSEPDSYDPQTGVVKFRPATSLGEGIHVCIFYARDIAGNEAPPAAVSFNVDLKGSPDSTRPLITPVSPLYDEVVYTRNPSFDFTIFDERSGVDSNTVSLHIDDEPVANSVVEYIPGTSGKDWDMYYYEKMKVLYSSLSGKMRYNSLNELKAINNQIEGLHTYRVAVMDKSGNRSKELHGRFRLVLDEAEPTIVSLSQSPSAAREPSEFKKLIDDSIAAIGNENLNYKAKLTFDSRTPDFSFLVYDEGKAQIDSDALTRFENIFIAIDGKRVEGKINVQALAGKENRTLVSFCPKEELTTFEEHVITATVKDRAGNKSSVASRIFTIVLDEKPPVIVSVKPENNALCRVIPEVSVTFFDKGGAGVDLKGLSISLDGTRIGSEVLTLKEMGSLSAYGPSDADSLSGTEGSIKSSMRFADSSSKVLTAPISDGLSEGKHILSVKVKDRVGNESILHNSSFIYSLDMENPELVTFSPPHRSEIDGWTVRVSAKVKGKGTSLDPSAVVLTLDGKKIAVPEGAFDAYEGTLLINVPIEDKSRNVHILGFDVGDYGGNYLKEPHISVFTTSGQLSKKESLSKADDSLVQERGDGK